MMNDMPKTQDQIYAYYGFQDWKIAFLMKGEEDDSLQIHIALKKLCGIRIFAPTEFDLFSRTYFPEEQIWCPANGH